MLICWNRLAGALFLNATGKSAYSQEHFIKIVYAKFGVQTERIMGNWKIENTCLLLSQLALLCPVHSALEGLPWIHKFKKIL